MTHDPVPLGDAGEFVTARRAMLAGLGGLAAGALMARSAQAGPLNPPPGPISSTPGPEPRIPVDQTNTPGSSTAIFRITQPGSYYLTGNVLGQSGKAGIEIFADSVTLDLMGFELSGVPGSLSGIRTLSPFFRQNITVRNGVVAGWGGGGLSLTHAPSDVGSVSGIIARNNTGVGISVGDYFTVSHCVARNNSSDGIRAQRNCLITHCISNANSGLGLSSNFYSALSHCVSSNNTGIGISVAFSSNVTACTSNNNESDGIVCSSNCTVTACTATSNDDAGIRPTGPDNRIEGNNCISNGVGIRSTSPGNFIARNTCGNNITNWDIAANNVCLVVNATLAPAVNGNSGGTSPGSTNPNANYTF